MNESALSDVRVLDLTWYVAGPYCTKLLADYGAEVIKVERPGQGDPARSIGPFLKDEPDIEKSGVFLHLNTNKKSITLNLKSQAGKKLLRQLVQEVDVLVESFSPRVMPSLGLDYCTLERINSGLVLTSVSNFGQTGPYRDYRLSELVLNAMGTCMKMVGQPDREPLKLGGNVLQYQAGVLGSTATMIALFGSKLNGTGQHVDVSLLETCLGSMDRRAPYLLAHQYTGQKETMMRVGGGRGGIMSGCPEGIYPCKDGYFDVAGGVPWWPRNFALLGSPSELADPEFATTEGQMDTQRQDAIIAVLYPWAMNRTKNEVWEAAKSARAALAPLYTTEDLVNDPHFGERGFFVEIEHPKAGRLRYPGAPFGPSETPAKTERSAPLLGEHNEEVYCGLGYSRQDLARLREGGAI
jgi:crotonobetainyl-CoA:carnitine CoA-transferase CaiB-like acyl-CoA transferase